MVTPDDEVNLTASGTATDNTGRRAYSVTLSSDVTDVNIALVPAGNVSVDADGIVSFADVNSDNVADVLADGTGVSIEFVNGSLNVTAAGSAGDAQVKDVAKQADGSVTFTVDSVETDEIIPVVYNDTTSDATNGLDLVMVLIETPCLTPQVWWRFRNGAWCSPEAVRCRAVSRPRSTATRPARAARPPTDCGWPPAPPPAPAPPSAGGSSTSATSHDRAAAASCRPEE